MVKLTKLSQEEMDNVIYDCRTGDLETIKAIFDSEVEIGVLPLIKDEFTKATPLHMASANGHLELVEYLLQELKGLFTDSEDEKLKIINSVNESGNTPLHWAAYNGHLEIVKILCEEGADPFTRNSYDHDVFFEASNNNQEKVEDYLLERYGEEIEDEIDQREDNGEQSTDANADEVQYTEGTEIEQIGKEDLEAVQEMKNLKV